MNLTARGMRLGVLYRGWVEEEQPNKPQTITKPSKQAGKQKSKPSKLLDKPSVNCWRERAGMGAF